ncbi:MAG: hypothetical protein IMF08_11165 [Proteobacteria bacterium]|nr:hypothetical protein [Pseudomonadota bacterium]
MSKSDKGKYRSAAWFGPADRDGGYQKLYVDHVLQAKKGADLDFLVGCRGAEVPRDSH